MYAKLINSELVFDPSDITIGQTHYIPPHPSWLAENRYKPVRYTEAPTEEGMYAVDHFGNFSHCPTKFKMTRLFEDSRRSYEQRIRI